MLDTTGLKFDSKLEENWFREDFPPRQQWVVPVGFPTVPGKEWTAMLTNKRTASISADTLFIRPGKSVDGIVIMSRGLPGIRNFVVEPNFEDDILFPNIEDTTKTITIVQMDSIQEAVKFRGWAIGPTAPPLNFIATVWCDTLISYTRQSVALGWLKDKRDDDSDDDEQSNDGVSKNLEKRIEKARKELVQGDSAKARKELEKFVKKVEKIYKKSEEFEKKKHENEIVMTSEAYALLKYNAEYLIDRLPEKRKKGEKE